MHILQLSEAEIAELNYERFQNPDPLVQKRLQSLYLSGVLGYSKTEAGKILGRHRNTVSTDLSCYQTGGMETLKQVNYGTNKSELAQHSTLLKTRFEEHPPISVKEAAQRIKELTGIERSPSQIHTFIKKQLGMKFVKTGHIPAKADPERQELWLENKLQPALDLAEQGLAHVSFMDAAHFVLAPFLYFLWCFERVFIKAPAGRKRLNVLGVNALTKEVYFISNQGRINANVIADLLHQLRIYYADMKPIYIVLDNARYQYCQFVKYVVAWQFNIHLIFLPPYSPNNKYH